MNTDDTKFSAGTLVQLNSGGPMLSVRSVENEEVIVEWFEGEKLKRHSFNIAQLKPVPENNLSDQESVRRIAFALQRRARQIPGFEKVDTNSVDELIDHVLSESPKRQE